MPWYKLYRERLVEQTAIRYIEAADPGAAIDAFREINPSTLHFAIAEPDPRQDRFDVEDAVSLAPTAKDVSWVQENDREWSAYWRGEEIAHALYLKSTRQFLLCWGVNRRFQQAGLPNLDFIITFVDTFLDSIIRGSFAMELLSPASAGA